MGTFRRLVEDDFLFDPSGIEDAFAYAAGSEERKRLVIDRLMNDRFRDGDTIKGFVRTNLGGPKDIFWIKPPGKRGREKVRTNYQLWGDYPEEIANLLGIDRYNVLDYE